MITLNTKTIYHQFVIDAIKIMKQLLMFCIAAGIEKKYGKLLNL